MKTLVIGTLCLDLIMNVDYLPQSQQDVNTTACSIRMGGMAYNVYHIMELLGCDCQLAAPIGTGRFANMMEEFLKDKNVKPIAKVENMDNGVCLCLVDQTGERTFISHHGAEYKFDKSWYKNVDFNEIDRIYIGGLEVEEDTGIQIVEMLEEVDRPVLFAPGPRCLDIPSDRFNRILDLKPILHINENETKMIGGDEDLQTAANNIYARTGSPVIITLSEKGAMVIFDNEKIYVDAKKCEVVDTIGAGDSHAGAMLACMQKGFDWRKSLTFANTVSGKCVSHKGAGVSQQDEIVLRELFK